jgi:hypothetical protein
LRVYQRARNEVGESIELGVGHRRDALKSDRN